MKKERRFKITPRVLMLVSTRPWKDEYLLEMTEYGEAGHADKKVVITLHQCVLSALPQVLDAIVQSKRRDLRHDLEYLNEQVEAFSLIGEEE